MDDTIGRGKIGVGEMHDPVWRSTRGVGALSQGGQGLRGSVVGSGKGEFQGRHWGEPKLI